MRIVSVRRTSQVFFLVLFVWFCIVSSFGLEWRQLRGWPVNWLLQLDPLVAVGTILTTGTLYSGLLWALLTVTLTILLGRFFCGWVCPMGTMQHFVGYGSSHTKQLEERASSNAYHPAQVLKYYILIFLLAVSAGPLAGRTAGRFAPYGYAIGIAAMSGCALWAVLEKKRIRRRHAVGILILVAGILTGFAFSHSTGRMAGQSLLTGLLDPIPLVYRSINLFLLPLADSTPRLLSVSQRYYEGAWLIGVIFVAVLLLSSRIPRFYCRYVCPLGAFFGIVGRFALFRVGRRQNECLKCGACEAVCEGACEPMGRIRTAECVLCMNCLDGCRHDTIGYQTAPSAGGETPGPDLSRRGAVAAVASGILLVPAFRLGGSAAGNWSPEIIRPPGALPEEDFLRRCIKCGQCMRVCPTNVIQPAEVPGGLESLWTPALNFRAGTSGCQLNCVACSHICPTAALRPIGIDEKLGRAAFEAKGPIRIGTAFVDQGRCLPWAMDRPCIVCQEICPVSPKAIFVREDFVTVRGGSVSIERANGWELELQSTPMTPGRFATGDYFLLLNDRGKSLRRPILENADRIVRISPAEASYPPPAPGDTAEIQVRLQRPCVDPKHCIGCGICEHECPVSGRRAIRVSAENESRNRKHSLLLHT